MTRIIFHIDMDSYFATAEQQANPLLRGKCIVVSGKEDSRTVIVAASKEAKKFGVKTAMTIWQAKKLCPSLYFVNPDADKYQEITNRFIEIFKKFTDKVQIYSIDEAFLDLTGFVKDFSMAKKIALKIKKLIKIKIGQWVTCSVGIADNKLLAKLASDMDKPDGIFIILPAEKLKIIDRVKLDDFCGLGNRILIRLENLGIQTVKKLRNYPKQELVKEFGPVYADFLYNLSRGQDFSEVIPDYLEPMVKSVSRSYTLAHDTADKKELCQVLLLLSEKCGRELRRKKLIAKTLQYYWRYEDFTGFQFRLTLSRHTNDSLQIYKIGEQHLINFRLLKQVRKIGVRVSNLLQEYKQISLWEKEQKQQNLIKYLDKINDRYGELTIKSGFLLDAQKLKRKVGGFRYGSD